MAGLRTPLSTLRHGPHGSPRMTQGRCGSLSLHRRGLAPRTSCRHPSTPTILDADHPPKVGQNWTPINRLRQLAEIGADCLWASGGCPTSCRAVPSIGATTNSAVIGIAGGSSSTTSCARTRRWDIGYRWWCGEPGLRDRLWICRFAWKTLARCPHIHSRLMSAAGRSPHDQTPARFRRSTIVKVSGWTLGKVGVHFGYMLR
jgi:hypothetical protein